MIRGVIFALVLALSACATRPPLEVACKGFSNYVTTLPENEIERAINDSRASSQSLASAPAAKVASLSNQVVQAVENGDPMRKPAALLLTGGGQWGAFGAGFLKTLRESRPDEYPDFRLITGVSTGAMQALILAAEDGDGGGELEALRKLAAEYSLPREEDYVDRGPMFMAALTGSVAGLGPLRRRIESALCANPSGEASDESCLLRAIARSNRVVLIGFVAAKSGEFQFADVAKIAKNEDPKTASACLAGVVLASAAMPVFFQTVKVDGAVYYDGGVRLSVFDDHTALALRATAENKCAPDAATCRYRLPTYVLRNGPTRLAPLEKPLARDAFSTAIRAETLMVNQLEINSISQLRLANPRGEIYLRTANGYDKSEVNGKQRTPCRKERERAMFEPEFMSCLMEFGKLRAESENAWSRLPPILDPNVTPPPPRSQ